MDGKYLNDYSRWSLYHSTKDIQRHKTYFTFLENLVLEIDALLFKSKK